MVEAISEAISRAMVEAISEAISRAMGEAISGATSGAMGEAVSEAISEPTKSCVVRPYTGTRGALILSVLWNSISM